MDLYLNEVDVIRNESGHEVGGLSLSGWGDTQIRDMVISRNYAGREAGGLRIGGAFDIDGLVVCDNGAYLEAGGLLVVDPEFASIRNGTICRNRSAVEEASAVQVSRSGS